MNIHDFNNLIDISAIDQLVDGQGEVDPTPAKDARVLFNAGRQLGQRADAALAGAIIASAFIKHPWLESFSMNLRSEPQMGDDGQTFDAIYLEVTDTKAGDTALPANLIDGGSFWSEAADAKLKELLEDDAQSLFEVVADHAAAREIVEHGERDFSFTFERSTIAPALAADAVSGAAVFALAFPHLTRLLTPELEKVMPASDTSALDEHALTTWLSLQLEEGQMLLEDVPKLMARYALASPHAMRQEFSERMADTDASGQTQHPDRSRA